MEEKYKKAKAEGIVRPITVLLDLDVWEIVSAEYKKHNRKKKYTQIVNELIRKGGKKE